MHLRQVTTRFKRHLFSPYICDDLLSFELRLSFFFLPQAPILATKGFF